MIALLVLLPLLSTVGPLAVPTAAAQSSPSLPYIDLTQTHGLVNQSQTLPLWGDILIGGSNNPDTIMGRCGCLLSALSTVTTYHLGTGNPSLGGSIPWFPVELNSLVIDPTNPNIPHRSYTRKGPSEYVSSFSPVYIDQFLQRGNLRDDYPPRWGYKSGFDDLTCGGNIHVDALETLANPRVVYDDAGNPVASTPSGVRLQWHDGFGAHVREVIDRNLMAGNPTIVGLEVWNATKQRHEGHVNVIVGWDPMNEQYIIVDPASPFYRGSELPIGSPDNNPKTYEGWERVIKGVFEVQPVEHLSNPPMFLRVSDDPAPFELLAINPDGQRSGYDPATGLILREDSTVNYYPQPLVSDLMGELPAPPAEHLLTVRDPRPGAYRFLATATGEGELILNFTTIKGSDLAEVGSIRQPIVEGEIVKIEAQSTGTSVESAVQVDNFTPEARAGGDVGGAVDAEVTFDGRRSFDVDGTITTYTWDYGDGTTGTDERPSHAYAAPGIYTVTLTVTDDRGATASATTRAVIGQGVPSQTSMISVSSTGQPGLVQGSVQPSISADGRYVAFQSGAWNLVSGDSNAVSDIFVRDHFNGVTARVSVSSSGAQAAGGSYDAAISADGRYVAFASDATNLVAGDTNGRRDIFVHDRETGTTERVSVASSGLGANNTSSEPAISADGRYVAFGSVATNLVTGDANGVQDIFVHDRETKSTERMSITSSGAEGVPDNASALPHSGAAAISGDGQVVVFESWARLTADDSNGRRDVYLRDRASGATERVSLPGSGGDIGGYLPATNRDGSVIAFVSGSGSEGSVVAYDRQLGELTEIGPGGDPRFPNPGDSLAMSRDGRYVAFAATGNVLPDDNSIEATHVYVRDRETGTLERVSVADSGEVATFWAYQFVNPAISDDGRFVAFSQGATDQRYRDTSLTPNDSNNQYDVFIRDRQEPTSTNPIAHPSGPYLGWAASEITPTSIRFTAEQSIGFTDTPLRARWDFGDGTPPVTTDGLTVSHAYAQPGTYTLTLTVADDLAESEPMTTTVEVVPALGAERLSLTPSCGDAGTSIQISGYNYPSSGGVLEDDGSIDSLLDTGWNFANGPLAIDPVEVTLSWQDDPLLLEPRLPDLLFEATVAIPSGTAAGAQAISSPGLEPVELSIPCPSVTNLPPVADAGGPDYTAITGVPAILDGSSSLDPEGAALTYIWDLNDGNDPLETDSSELAYTFRYPGTYVVTLIVNDGERDSLTGPGSRSYAIVTVTGDPPSDSDDTTPPATTATLAPEPNAAGWHNGYVVVTLTASDEPDGSGVAEINVARSGVETTSSVVAGSVATVTVSTDGETTLTYFARDLAGNAEPAKTLTIRIDQMAPTVAYSGNAGTYTIDQPIAITCTASDSLSGVASDTCEDVIAPASTIGPGTWTVSAGATDRAGNTGEGTTTFTVLVTYDSLCALTRQLVEESERTPGHANRLGESFCAKLRAAADADARGNEQAKAGALGAYINQVKAQTPTTFTRDQEAMLVAFANTL